MADEKDPIHVQCWMHENQCDNIKDTHGEIQRVKKNFHAELVRMQTIMDKFIKARTIFWLLGLTSTGFLSLFGYSVHMNATSVEGSIVRDKKQQTTINEIAGKQNNVLVEIRGLQGTLHEVQSDVEELKVEMKELH